MGQASAWWQQVSTRTQQSPLAERPMSRRSTRQFQRWARRQLKQMARLRLRGSATWALGFSAVAAMLVWDWRLLVAIGMGSSAMLLVYLAQDWHWQIRLADFQRWLNEPQRKLMLAAISGAAVTLSTYLAAAMWSGASNHWVATGAILQGTATLAVLLLLVWHMAERQANRDAALLDGWLTDLTDADAVKRLTAVRRLTQKVTDARCDRAEISLIADAFYLMLNSEPETIVQDAVFEGLQTLQSLSPAVIARRDCERRSPRKLSAHQLHERPLVEFPADRCQHREPSY